MMKMRMVEYDELGLIVQLIQVWVVSIPHCVRQQSKRVFQQRTFGRVVAIL